MQPRPLQRIHTAPFMCKYNSMIPIPVMYFVLQLYFCTGWKKIFSRLNYIVSNVKLTCNSINEITYILYVYDIFFLIWKFTFFNTH